MKRRFQPTLTFLRRYIRQHGYGPTVREVVAGLGLSSTSVAHYHLRALERDGLIRRLPGSPRAMRILNGRRKR